MFSPHPTPHTPHPTPHTPHPSLQNFIVFEGWKGRSLGNRGREIGKILKKT
ncbi:hypothetical protein [Microcystis sp. M169S2]|uniref:hypothetical protein n=1 Tax=Microcystis sp. M169S2 TaxID=2771157 RepID=UPI00258509AB|nr:hypothetical protein [Microcystis sp. M169S2]